MDPFYEYQALMFCWSRWTGLPQSHIFLPMYFNCVCHRDLERAMEWHEKRRNLSFLDKTYHLPRYHAMRLEYDERHKDYLAQWWRLAWLGTKYT